MSEQLSLMDWQRPDKRNERGQFIRKRIAAGTRFGKLVFLRDDTMGPNRKAWFQCDCGTVKAQPLSKVIRGVTLSCGCLIGKANRQHGALCDGTETLEYRAWRCMRGRCKAYHKSRRYYHDQGVYVCERWNSFEAFFADMGPIPGPHYTVDRINNAKGYEPSNCRWATQKEQQRNRRSNHRVSAFGKTQTIVEWGEELGLKPPTICKRLLKGWTPEAALQPLLRSWTRRNP